MLALTKSTFTATSYGQPGSLTNPLISQLFMDIGLYTLLLRHKVEEHAHINNLFKYVYKILSNNYKETTPFGLHIPCINLAGEDQAGP